MKRHDGRDAAELRPISIQPDFLDTPLGSALITWGNTRVLCTASVEERLPPWMAASKRGWVTAEYAMHPASTDPRKRREGGKGSVSGRSQEIQRLVGRSLRQAVNMKALGPRQIVVDCDVLQADGGTRTASITGGWVALSIALNRLIESGAVGPQVFGPQIAAVSVGIVGDQVLCDLDYPEDSKAQTDANFVLAPPAGLIEVQATAENGAFSDQQLGEMVQMATTACQQIAALQREVVAAVSAGA
jgi:ribonuclease PH